MQPNVIKMGSPSGKTLTKFLRTNSIKELDFAAMAASGAWVERVVVYESESDTPTCDLLHCSDRGREE